MKKNKVIWLDPINSDAQFLNLSAGILKKRGFDLTIISNQRPGFEKPSGVDWVEFSAVPTAVKKYMLIWKLFTFVFYMYSLFRAITYIKKARVGSIIFTSKLSLVAMDTLAIRLLKLSGVRIVYLCHKPFPDYYKRRNDPDEINKYKKFYSKVDKLLVMNSYTKHLLSDLYGVEEDKFIVSCHPSFSVFVSEISENRKLSAYLHNEFKNKFVITMTSNWSEEHGLDCFFDNLECLTELRNRIAFCLFIKMDEVDFKSKVRSRIKEKLGEIPVFAEIQPYSYEDLLAALNCSSVVVTPYEWGTQSGVIALAGSVGIPSIATDVGGISEMITDGENGYLYARKNWEELRNNLKNLMDKPILKNRVLEATFGICSDDKFVSDINSTISSGD